MQSCIVVRSQVFLPQVAAMAPGQCRAACKYITDWVYARVVLLKMVVEKCRATSKYIVCRCVLLTQHGRVMCFVSRHMIRHTYM